MPWQEIVFHLGRFERGAFFAKIRVTLGALGLAETQAAVSFENFSHLYSDV